jgi:hypothetical protein
MLEERALKNRMMTRQGRFKSFPVRDDERCFTA